MGIAPMCAILFLSAATSAAEPAAQPGFTRKPVVTRVGSGAKTDFAIDRETDVAVCIENAGGQVVRHLVAGVLGKNAPAPLKADSLAQSLVWDGKDDLGKSAEGGPFKVRVGLGLHPTFDGLIGFRPEALGGARQLATGPDGSVYVFHSYGASHTHDDSTVCAVFNRDGQYVKTILPYPANLPEDRLNGIKRVDIGNGVKVPFVYQFETRSLIPGLGDLPRQRAVVTRDGRLAFVGVQEGPQPFAQAGEARLTVVRTDGSVPDDGVLKALIHPLTDSAASLALSPDEKTLYATGVRACTHAAVKPGAVAPCDSCVHGGETWRHTIPTGKVYRFGWSDAQAAEFGKAVSFKEPVSVATDKDGNVYVADQEIHRVFGRLWKGTYDRASAAPVRFEYTLGTTWTYGWDVRSDLVGIIDVFIASATGPSWFSEATPRVHAAGGKIWFCTFSGSIPQSPRTAMFSPLLAWRLGLDGLMPSWASLIWGADPWHEVPGSGATTFFYPGSEFGTDDTYPSLRLKALRNMMQTVDHLALAAGRVKGSRQAVAARVDRALGFKPRHWYVRRPKGIDRSQPHEWTNASHPDYAPKAAWSGISESRWRALERMALDMASGGEQ